MLNIVKKVLMGAFFSLDFVKTIVEVVILFLCYLKGLFLPDHRGACPLLPKVINQLQELEHQKLIHAQYFPGSGSSFTLSERCQWMAKIKEACPIGQITWPGTHYSATSTIGIPFITRPFGQRQTLSIYDQLVYGVRALDIRVQQDRLVCNGSMLCNTTIGDIIEDIKLFLKNTEFEILILEVQTESGFCDPERMEDYLVEELGDLLIHQDDQVFSKSIAEVLPRRIICIWKPIIYARKLARQGGPIWSGKYLKCDEIDTQMPLTRFDANINNLRTRSLALKTNKFFYKVENTLNPNASTILESLLIWPKHASVVSRRIDGFARTFLGKCHNGGILHRLQICSVDFVDDDFISACIGLNYELFAIKETGLLKTTPNESNSTNIKISKGSSSIRDISGARDINTYDNTSITWEKCIFTRIKANTLNITHVEDDKCWRWVPRTPTSSDQSAAQLLEICSLQVSGDYEIDMHRLRQGLRYEVLFWVKVLDSAFGWDSPVHVRLVLPDGSIQENQVILDSTPTSLLCVPVGTFVMSLDMKGEIKFSLEQLDNSLKGGIIIVGVLIQPTFVDMVIPRDLSFNLDDAGKCLLWSTVRTSFAKREVEVAVLKGVRNFKVHGQFETGKLLLGCTYKVGFMILLLRIATGWESLTKLTLVLPDGSSQERIGSFKDMRVDTYVKFYVGEFKMSPELIGTLEFSMENKDELEKRGMWIEMAFIEQRH